MGNGETLGRGSIQFMTAGTGVTHQEHNRNARNPLRFIQMWITPSARGLDPNYGSMRGDEMKKARNNAWAHLVSDTKNEATTPVKINADANIHVTELSPASSLDFNLGSDRQAYLLCVEGSADVVGARVEENLVQVSQLYACISVDLRRLTLGHGGGSSMTRRRWWGGRSSSSRPGPT
eukprot:332811-Rhodomonas_salina.1